MPNIPAPASETIKLARFIKVFLMKNSVSREAVPFPIEMASIL
jgi:hypothetical protein